MKKFEDYTIKELQERINELETPKWELDDNILDIIDMTVTHAFEGWTEYYYWLNNEQSKQELELYLKMLKWKHDNDSDFEPDWENITQKKWFILYDMFSKEYFISNNMSNKINMQVYFSSGKKAQRCIKDLELNKEE